MKRPAYQWYPADADTDEVFRLMTYEQEGVYRRLLDHQWNEGSIPADPQVLASLLPKMPRDRFVEIWPLISAKFRPRGSDRLVNDRLEVQRRQRDKYVRTQKANVRKRWDKSKMQPKSGNTTVSPVVEPSQYSSSSSSTPSSTPTKNTQTPRALALAGTFPRDHLKHGWCSSRGKCVPEFLHEEFIRSVGGDRASADQRLRVFYEAREHGWPEGPIGDDPVKLWRREFAACFPSVAPMPVSRDRTSMLHDATKGFLGS